MYYSTEGRTFEIFILTLQTLSTYYSMANYSMSKLCRADSHMHLPNDTLLPICKSYTGFLFVCVLIIKSSHSLIIHGSTPHYLCNFIQPYTPSCSLRLASLANLHQPRNRLKTMGNSIPRRSRPTMKFVRCICKLHMRTPHTVPLKNAPCY